MLHSQNQIKLQKKNNQLPSDFYIMSAELISSVAQKIKLQH